MPAALSPTRMHENAVIATVVVVALGTIGLLWIYLMRLRLKLKREIIVVRAESQKRRMRQAAVSRDRSARRQKASRSRGRRRERSPDPEVMELKNQLIKGTKEQQQREQGQYQGQDGDMRSLKRSGKRKGSRAGSTQPVQSGWEAKDGLASTVEQPQGQGGWSPDDALNTNEGGNEDTWGDWQGDNQPTLSPTNEYDNNSNENHWDNQGVTWQATDGMAATAEAQEPAQEVDQGNNDTNKREPEW